MSSPTSLSLELTWINDFSFFIVKKSFFWKKMNVFDWLKILLSCTYRWTYFIRNIKPVLHATTGKHFRKSCRKFDFWWILVCLFIFCWGFSNLFTHQITCSRCRIPSSRIFQIHGICQRILPHFAFMSFISSHFYRIEYTGNGSKLEIPKNSIFKNSTFQKIVGSIFEISISA